MNHQAYELIINALGGPDAVGKLSSDLLKHEELHRCCKLVIYALAEKLDDNFMHAFNRLEYCVDQANHSSTMPIELLANNIGKACVAMKVTAPLIF